MSYASKASDAVPWWREPTKDQWYAFIAAWLGWTLDAFDFTVFLVIMVAIAKEFHEPLTAVTIVFTLTLWCRLLGAVSAGWMADRMGRKAPLMISILWYSFCNFAAGFSPSFVFLLVARTLLGLGMGAEWPAGCALAMETWPPRSRGLMSSILQGSWALGYLLSALLYATVFEYIGWRGMLWMGVLPALAVVWIRVYVKEPAVWVENQKIQKARKAEVKAPLIAIFRRGMIVNTLTACWWMASGFVVYYSVFGLFATYLTRDLHMSPSAVGWPLVFTNAATFVASFLWGGLSDKIGRRWAMIIPAILGFCLTPIYLLTADYTTIVIAFTLQGACAGAIYGQNPSYLSERFPTEVRATAVAFCYHQGTIFAGLIAPVLTYLAVNKGLGFAMPMLVLTSLALISFVCSLLVGPETKGKVLVADMEILPAE
ncbi:MAG TPA: MFS transporter [Rhodopila sp.]|jgi:SHS family lactate transporter-like MFS transporter